MSISVEVQRLEAELLENEKKINNFVKIYNIGKKHVDDLGIVQVVVDALRTLIPFLKERYEKGNTFSFFILNFETSKSTFSFDAL